MVHTGISHFLKDYNLKFFRSLLFDLFRGKRIQEV